MRGLEAHPTKILDRMTDTKGLDVTMEVRRATLEGGTAVAKGTGGPYSRRDVLNEVVAESPRKRKCCLVKLPVATVRNSEAA